MLPTRVYYIRISDDRQDTLRQVNGLKELARQRGDGIPDSVWQSVLDKRPVGDDSPVLWDWGSRDMIEERPRFKRLIQRVEAQDRRSPARLQEVCIYELDRFGVEGPDEWFHYRYVFNNRGAKITSFVKGDLTAKDDLRTIIETLFEAVNSRAEQKKIAGRTAHQMAERAKKGEYQGGVPRYGYDQGCFDGDRLLWRLHYHDATDRVQIIATPENPNAELTPTAQTIVFKGQNNHPKRGKLQRYELLPSIDAKRIEGVKYLFATAQAQFECISPSELARKFAAMGYTSYHGRAFDADNLLLMLEDRTYIGLRPYGKRSVARHKRYSKTSMDTDGRPLEDVPEDRKGKTVWRTHDEQILPEDKTHKELIDEPTFSAVQGLLAKRPKREKFAPRSDDGWLKPVLYCGGCGRAMICRRYHGKQGYVCVTHANYRYRRPGDPRFTCSAGLNRVRHEELEPAILNVLDHCEPDLLRMIEVGAIHRLEEVVARYEAAAKAGATTGFRNYLRLIWDALELDDHPGEVATVIERLMAVTEAEAQLAGLTEVERLLPPVVRLTLDQAAEEHRRYTKAIGKAEAAPRQIAVWEDECRKLDDRMGKLEQLLSPYREQLDLAARAYEDKRRQLVDARLAVTQSGNREKGAACARFFSRILIWPKKGKKPRRLLALPFYPDDRTAAFGDMGEIAQLYEENQHPDMVIRGYLFEMGQRLRFQMNYSFLKRCPSPLSSKVHGSPRMW